MYRITLMDGEVVKADNCYEDGTFLVCDDVRYAITNVKKMESEDSSVIGTIVGGLFIAAITGGLLS